MTATSGKHLQQDAWEGSWLLGYWVTWLLGYFQRPERAGYFSTGQRPVAACTVFFRGKNNHLLKNISRACHGIAINSGENTSRIGNAHQGKYFRVRNDRHKWKTLAAGCGGKWADPIINFRTLSNAFLQMKIKFCAFARGTHK